MAAGNEEAHKICTLIGHGKLNRLSQVLTYENSNLVDSTTGKTLLHTAIEKRQNECVRLLLDKGAKANLLDKNGFSPIQHAAYESTPDIVQMLIDKEPTELNAQTPVDKYTPLMLAVRNNRPEMVAKLLQLQADRTITDKHDRTALDIAKLRGYTECVRLFSVNHFVGRARPQEPFLPRLGSAMPRVGKTALHEGEQSTGRSSQQQPIRGSETERSRRDRHMKKAPISKNSLTREKTLQTERLPPTPLDFQDERVGERESLTTELRQVSQARRKLGEERKEFEEMRERNEQIEREEDEKRRRRIHVDFLNAERQLLDLERTVLEDKQRNAEMQKQLEQTEIRCTKVVKAVLERKKELDEKERKLKEKEEAVANEKKSVEELRRQLEIERKAFEREKSEFEREKQRFQREKREFERQKSNMTNSRGYLRK